MLRKIALSIPVAILFVSVLCEKDPSSHESTTALAGYVLDASDSTGIYHANVVVYDANTNAPVTRTSSKPNGYYSFNMEPGAFYLKISAQKHLPSPPKNGTPLSFQILAGDTTWKTVYLDADQTSDSCGTISGTVKQPDSNTVVGALVVATDTVTGISFSTTSGPDGYYVIFNVQPGLYSMQGFLAGYKQAEKPVVYVNKNSIVNDCKIVLYSATNATLSGQITFLASQNSVVDITLIHPLTRDAIPGLSTYNNATTNTYQLTSVPPGRYIAWASFRNDGYVMDPDRIQKFGLPLVTIPDSAVSVTCDFDVTDVIPIVSPTNPADTILPRLITTRAPAFVWKPYPSAKEYIIEVSNSKGEIVWGGADSTGTILHFQIPKENTSIVYNFDNTASDSLLHIGETYRWKIYADNNDDLNIQVLISSSEDLLGIFKVVADSL